MVSFNWEIIVIFVNEIFPTFSVSIFCEVVVVGIDASTESHSLSDPRTAYIIIAIEWQIDLEEAGVSNRVASLAHVVEETNLMLAGQA